MEILFIFCSVLVVFNGLTNAQNPCKTPDQKDGICISLYECVPLMKIVARSTQADINFVRNSQCGTVDNSPLVCCVEPTFRKSDFPQPGQCGSQLKERIVGGEMTSITDYPWLVLIEYTRPGSMPAFSCGGSLINKDYVVTAAHCIKSPKLQMSGWTPKSIRLGEHDLRNDPDCEENACAAPIVNINIGEIIVHEAYKPSSNTQHHDIALIRMAHSVELTDWIKPVCLPFAQHLRDGSFDNVHLSVAGFGRIENYTSSDVKLKVEIDSFNWNECNTIYGRTLIQSQLCAGGEEGRDSCNGDSGGPLMRDYKFSQILPVTYLAGIVSRGPSRCGAPGYPAIYTRVDKFLFWIRHQMKP